MLYWSARPDTSGVDSKVVNIWVEGLYPSSLLIMWNASDGPEPESGIASAVMCNL